MESQKMLTGFTSQNIPSIYMHLQQQQQQQQHKRTTIGFVVEVIPSEMRVALTPAAVRELVAAGQTVYFQTEAGLTAGFTDEMYQQSGATKLQTAQEVYQRSHIMMKVQQPTTQEYHLVQPQQIFFCFMTMNENNAATKQQNVSQFKQAMSQRQATVFSYEWMLSEENSAPVMNALSEVAGDMAVQQAMRMMETKYGGKGELLSQVAGEEAARVLIIGSGVAAMRAARMASAIGAQVTVMDLSTENLRWIREQLKTPVQTLAFNAENLEKVLPETKILIGAVIPSYSNAEEDLKREQATLAQVYSATFQPLINTVQLLLLKKDSVVIDLAVAYGGNFELDNRVFHCVDKDTQTNGLTTVFAPANITNLVPKTASKALANATVQYVKKVASLGWQSAAAEDQAIRRSVIVADGEVKKARFWELLNETEHRAQGQSVNAGFDTQKSNFFEENKRINAEQHKAVKQLLHIISNQTNTASRFPIEA